ncbi:MAG TPA: glycosyltransferase family 2 protein [Flavipsychrobacter sp.]|nr:glycosyltransferase family 2 protein [Flavipsychrobacter sp.]
MESQFISIIIPFYNTEAYLTEAIESVLQQTYDNWELLLIDDGSTDSGTQIAKQYAEQYANKIKYLMHEQHKNRGLTASRNLGLQQSCGEYIALLDADDYWLPEKLSTQVAIAEAHPECALIGGASLYWYSWQDSTKEDVVIQVGCKADEIIYSAQLNTILYPLGKGAAPCPCSLLIKTDAIKKHKGFEEQFSGIFQAYEDQAFLSKLYLNEQCYMSSQWLDKYRQRNASLVGNIKDKQSYRMVRLFFLKWLQNYLKEQKVNTPAIWKALNSAIFECKYPLLHKGIQWLSK